MISEDETERKSCLEDALAYADKGWRLFPVVGIEGDHCACNAKASCGSPGKHPLIAKGCNGASSDVETIRSWWNRWPNANVGIATGEVSGIWVLDADGENGIRAVEELEEQFGKLPQTPIAITGGGGRHFYFRLPSGQTIGNTMRLCRKPIDVRGNGGYVCAAPSLHKSGRKYEWLVSPDQVNPALAPDWLLEMVTKKKLPSGSTSNSNPTIWIEESQDLVTHPGVGQGRRHGTAASLVGHHLSRGETAKEILPKALKWANRCKPPMPEEEIQKIVEDLQEKETLRAKEAEKWDEPPTSFFESKLPVFPINALSCWLRDFVEAEAVATQTPADLAALVCLSVVAASCSKIVQVRVNSGYAEPMNIFTAIALPPANRKSAVFQDSVTPLQQFERDEYQKIAPDIAKSKNAQKVSEMRLARLQKEAADAQPEKQRQQLDAADKLAQELEKIEIPKPPKWITADATAEALTTLLMENHGKMAVMSPEGDVFDLIMGRYSRGVPNFDVYLKGHAGDDVRIDRRNRPSEYVRQPALTLCLAVQPEVIFGLGSRRELRGRGLLARFLYSMPVSFIGSRNPNPPVMPGTIRTAYDHAISTLLKLPPQLNEEGEIVSNDLLLSSEAEDLRIRFATWLEPLLGVGGDLDNITDWAGKLTGAIVRIAGILHMAENAAERIPWAKPISGDTMERAIQIGRYLMEHARAAFNLMGTDPDLEDAKYFLNWIERKELSVFSQRDAMVAMKCRFKKVDAMQPALKILVSHNWIRLKETTYRGKGRPSSSTYQVNPLGTQELEVERSKTTFVPFVDTFYTSPSKTAPSPIFGTATLQNIGTKVTKVDSEPIFGTATLQNIGTKVTKVDSEPNKDGSEPTFVTFVDILKTASSTKVASESDSLEPVSGVEEVPKFDAQEDPQEGSELSFENCANITKEFQECDLEEKTLTEEIEEGII